MAEKPETAEKADKPTLLTTDAETAYKLQLEQLARENAALRAELAAYKQHDEERSAAEAKAKASKGAIRATAAVALVGIRHNGKEIEAINASDPNVVPSAKNTVPAEALPGLREGVHYKFMPIG